MISLQLMGTLYHLLFLKQNLKIVFCVLVFGPAVICFSFAYSHVYIGSAPLSKNRSKEAHNLRR